MYPCTLTNAYVKQPVYQKHMVSGRFSAFLLTVFSLISEVINSHFFMMLIPCVRYFSAISVQ